MIKRRLGRTNFQVSIVGFGAIPIQQCSVDQAKELVHTAVQAGINFFDTARGYTTSEELLGLALKDLEEEVYVATKTMGRTYEAAKKDFEVSYRNLQREAIDLYQFHNVSKPEEYEQVMGPGGAMEFFKEIQAQGLIREIGITSHSADLLARAIESGEFATAQFPYNAVESQGEPIFQRCQELDLGTIAMKPIAGGVLMNHGEESLRYILENENLTLAIPGMATVEEVQRNTALARDFQPLSPQEREELLAQARALGDNFCRRCNYCQPCPTGINISGLFTLDLYLTKYGLEDWARDRYRAQEKTAKDCIQCGLCQSRCPYELPIIDKLQAVARHFQE